MNSTLSMTKGDAENVGRWLMAGAANELARTAFWVVFAVAVISLAADFAGGFLGLPPGDDTDVSWAQHSGLRPRRDALTGCEYLETHDGGITPRLRADGHQVCR